MGQLLTMARTGACRLGHRIVRTEHLVLAAAAHHARHGVLPVSARLVEGAVIRLAAAPAHVGSVAPVLSPAALLILKRANRVAQQRQSPASVHDLVAVLLIFGWEDAAQPLALPPHAVHLALPARSSINTMPVAVHPCEIEQRVCSGVARTAPRPARRKRRVLVAAAAAWVVLLAGSVAGGNGGTYAAWSDSSAVPDNRITAGTWGPLEIEVAIKFGSDPNSINWRSNGNIPVTVFSSVDDPAFDPADLDWTTVRFGDPDEPAAAPRKEPALDEDRNDDGIDDATYHFGTQDTGLDDSSVEACLTGMTEQGVEVRGCDDVRPVPPATEEESITTHADDDVALLEAGTLEATVTAEPEEDELQGSSDVEETETVTSDNGNESGGVADPPDATPDALDEEGAEEQQDDATADPEADVRDDTIDVDEADQEEDVKDDPAKSETDAEQERLLVFHSQPEPSSIVADQGTIRLDGRIEGVEDDAENPPRLVAELVNDTSVELTHRRDLELERWQDDGWTSVTGPSDPHGQEFLDPQRTSTFPTLRLEDLAPGAYRVTSVVLLADEDGGVGEHALRWTFEVAAPDDADPDEEIADEEDDAADEHGDPDDDDRGDADHVPDTEDDHAVTDDEDQDEAGTP
jgi:predicted ribosomally synthesized peptide with SipW-like signal peptide